MTDKPKNSITSISKKKKNKAVGNPPDYFTDDLKEIWQEIKNNAINGVFFKSDRLILESICHLVDLMRTPGEEMTAEHHEVLINCLDKCGMTPESRQRLGL